MNFTAFLQKRNLLSFVILLTYSTLSCVECSYSIRDEDACEEMYRWPVCTVNYSARCCTCSDLQTSDRLPRPTVWLSVALLSALAGGAACWLANLLAPPPGYRGKASMKHSSGNHQLPTDTLRTQQAQTWLTNRQGSYQHIAT